MHSSLIGTSVVLDALALLPVSAQTAPAASTAPGSKAQRAQAELLITVKAAKAKVNDPVAARTVAPFILADGNVIPVGSKLVGHVQKVESDSVDRHMSSIAITFESVELKKQAKMPLKLSVAAAMPSVPTGTTEPTSKLLPPSSGPLPNDHPLNGHAYDIGEDTGNLINEPTHGYSGISDTEAGGTQGKPKAAHIGSVIGLPGVTLQIDGGPDAVSTFASAKKNLQLDAGLQLMLVVVQ